MVNTVALSIWLLLFGLCFGTIHGSITHTSGSTITLLQYGSAESLQIFLFESSDAEKLMQTTLNASDERIITSHQIRAEKVTGNKFKISATIFFDLLPGEVNYSVNVVTQTLTGESNTYTIQQTHSVYGMVFIDNSDGGKMQVISGDFGVGYNLSSFSDLDADPFRVRSIVHVPKGVDLEPSVQVEGQQETSEILEEDDVIVDEEGLLIMPQPYRTGSAMVIIKSDNLKLNNESFETAIAINIPRVPEAPAVVSQKGMQKVMLSSNGSVEVALDMFNVRKNARLTLLLDDMALTAVMNESVANKYEQRILFRGVAHAGKFDVHVRLELESGVRDVVSLYETFVVINKVGERDKSGTLNVLGILLIVFGCLGVLVILTVMRILWASQKSEEQDREMRDRCICNSGEEGQQDVQVIRDIYARGSEQV